MALFKVSKGLKANLPSAKTEGYCWYTTDDSLFYIDYKDENGSLQRKALNAKDAETLTGASLSTILNSSDVEIPTSKAVLNALNAKLDKADAGSDWNQNDDTRPDYVKNRPFYTGDPVETVLVEESTVSFSFSESEGAYLAQHPTTFSATVGKIYKVYWDGTVYECTCVEFNNLPVIGNLSIAGVGSDTGEPFLVVVKNNGRGINIGTKDTAASHTFSISGIVQEVVKIDEKYLPTIPADKLSEVPQEVFWATYGATTYSEVSKKIDAGIAVFVMYNKNIYIANTKGVFPNMITFTNGVNINGTLNSLRLSSSNAWSFNSISFQESNVTANQISAHNTATDAHSDIRNTLSNKVDKVSGKGLSTNDYTTNEKNKLSGIETGANKIVVDSSLSTISTNPVQNSIITSNINSIKTIADAAIPNPSTKEGGQVLVYNNTEQKWKAGYLPNGLLLKESDYAFINSTDEIIYDGLRFISLGSNNGVTYSRTSKDGIYWGPKAKVNVSVDPNTITYGNGIYILTSGSRIYRSFDCINFELTSQAKDDWVGVLFGNGKFVTSIDRTIHYSTDGKTWVDTGYNSYISNYCSQIFGNGMFIIKQSYRNGIVSSDGITWVETQGLPNVASYDINFAYGNGTFIYHSGKSSKIYYSTDGINWSESNSPTIETCNLAFGNGKFVCAPNRGNIMYSEDGISWTESNEPTFSRSLVFGADKFIAVGTSGAIGYSTDGITWDGTSYLVLVGDSGSVIEELQEVLGIQPFYVLSINGRNGDVTLSANDIGAFPDTDSGKSLILSSSTTNSTKQFKITVDDDYNVSATNTSDSVSKTLATTEYVDNSVSNPLNITSATVGQIAKISAVDDTGKPTTWETINIPTPFKPEGKYYLTFSSPNSFTLRVSDFAHHWDGYLEYFASNKTWTHWNAGNALSAVDNGGEYVLYLRGIGNTKIAGDSTNYKWVLSGNNIKCIGNIENLLDYETVASGNHPTMADRCYANMFYGCTALTQAPALPATTLTNGCYNSMFFGCTSLTKAPALPATTLADWCYAYMFRGCTSLTQAPYLPATTLSEFCYQQMFLDCASLTQAPALPATTLTTQCYYQMFRGCTSLTQAPYLPATTLAQSCYASMFYGCTSLTKEPLLPATTLADSCYQQMFYGCTSLKLSSTQTEEYTQEYRIPTTGTGTTATDALSNMFTNTGGNFMGAPEINTTYYLSTDNMIVHETEIATLREYVESMIDSPFKPAGKSYLTFSSPSSFTLALGDATKGWDGTLEYFASNKTWTTWDGTTTLSAVDNDGEYVLYLRGTGNTVITGPSSSYKWVLTGSNISCIGNIENLLDYATVAAGNHPTMAEFCYPFMFYGCTALTQAPTLPATTLAESCYSYMFQGCTALTQAPALPATTLANYCYASMFYGCTSLTQAPALPATTLTTQCYYQMFRGCTSLTQAPYLPATTLAQSCYASMFYGCTSLTKEPLLPATTLADSCYQQMFYGCTSLKLSSTQTEEYTQEYRIPTTGTGTTATDALSNMFTNTGGNFMGAPEINTTYYLSTDNMIVRDTEVATLNGYVGSMIDAAIGNAIGGSY